MSDQTSIFNKDSSEETPPVNNQTPTPNDQLANLLTDIRNEKGEQKYRSVEDALYALKHSQEYIPELSSKLKQQEQELIAAKQAAEKIAELERVVKALTEQNEPPKQNTPANEMTSEKVAELVSSVLSQRETEQVKQGNIKTVVDNVKSAFGEKADEIFYGKAAELGMSAEQFNNMAATSPKAVLKLLGLENQQQPHSLNTASSTLNTTGFESPKSTFVTANRTRLPVGATSQELHQESVNAKKMVDELHASGKSVHDLTDPKVYFKHFNI